MIILITGVMVGLVLGLTGAGGSVFAVPMFILFLQLPAQQAMGLSLAVVAISAFYGTLLRLKSHEIQWLPAAVYALIGALTAPVGSKVNQLIDQSYLMAGFCVLVFIVAFKLWQSARLTPNQAKHVRASVLSENEEQETLCQVNANRPFRIGFPCVMGMSGGAILTGFLSGLFGVGGGFLIVPTLMALSSLSMKQAVATSLAVISLISLSGLGYYVLSKGGFDADLLVMLGTGGILGMTIGVWLSRYIAGPFLQKLFAVMMILMAAAALIETFGGFA